MSEHETERLERHYAAEQASHKGASLASLVQHSQDRLSLSNIHIAGAKHTRPAFLQSICYPFLPALHPSSSAAAAEQEQLPGDDEERLSLSDILKRTRDLAETLRGFDIFKEVDAGLDESRDGLARPRDVDLILKVQEKGRFFLKTATDVGNGEGSATVTAKVRNLFGGAESLEGYAAYGTRTKSAYHLSLTSPLTFLGLTPSPKQLAEFSAFALTRDLSTFASCKENVMGLSAKARAADLLDNPGWSAEAGYEAAARSLSDFEPFASIAMRQSAGAHLKSALVSKLMFDNTDPFSPIPRFGLRSTLSSEYAGLGGDARHLKLSAQSTSYHPLSTLRDIFCSFSFHTGLLFPFSSSAQTHFSDKFRLGGPTSVRGFKWNQMGPRDHIDYTGGELSYAAGASLFAPFPFKPEWPLQSHLWLNAGNLANWQQHQQQQSKTTALKQWASRPSVAAGLGLVYSNGALRAELNFGVPLVSHKTDGHRPGLQLGIGIEFL